jgi:sugar phosphate isomerase/epimerase
LMYTRRDFAKLAVAGMPLAKALGATRVNSVIGGVMIGAQSYSFRDLPLDGCIAAMAQIGLGECELYSPHTELKGSREELRKWRVNGPIHEMKAVRKKFDDAGINLCAYNLSFKDDFTDEEIEAGFKMTEALGVNVITASSTLTCAKRLVPFVDRHKSITVAFHGHADIDRPNEFAKPESFAAALAMSKRFAVNLDIGHFVAAGYDPVEYIKANHDRILILHLKDRKKNDRAANLLWGQGDTPIKQVLQLLKKEKYPMRALIEYEYKGPESSTAEVRKCFQYCKDALA